MFTSSLLAKVLVLSVLANTVSVTLNRDTITAINTLLNFASWWLLIKAQKKLREEVSPKLDSVEETLTNVLESSLPGGRRKLDPPHPPKDIN